MASNQRKADLRIDGMTCISCQNRIEKKLQGTNGVRAAFVSYTDGMASVTYDPDIVTMPQIEAAIEKLGYEAYPKGGALGRGAGAGGANVGTGAGSGGTGAGAGTAHQGLSRVIGILIIIVALFAIFQRFGLTNIAKNFPVAEEGMGYGLLFLIGLLTSVHCIAMCGGINLSQCIPAAAKTDGHRWAAVKPSLQYNIARVLSYTIIGTIVGAVGTVLTFSGPLKGAVQLIAGVFMVIMGLNMFGILPGLRRIVPHLPGSLSRKIDAKQGKSRSPVIIGLLNGLMPCGPLQAMQLFALSTGSPVKGGLSMLFFSLGTLPLMFGLGALSSILSKRFTARVMTVGAALVVFLGLFMFTNGMSLSGIRLPQNPPETANTQNTAAAPDSEKAPGAATLDSDGVQKVSSELKPGGYPHITVKAGVPVKWTIDAPPGSINGCNQTILIPDLDMEYTFEEGENIIEFTPTSPGDIPYSCWMGMIRAVITVEA
jgi:sulfite exporter TauE/SafE/copper chaperone CopZ